MTILLFGLGALAASVGTRVAAVLFVGAAVAGALNDFLPALSVWTAAMAAGLIVRPGLASRRLALPALGAGAVLAAASSSNSAAVMGLWVIGTAVVYFGAGEAAESRRSALIVCLADLPLAGVVIYHAIDTGFEAWPPVTGSRMTIALLVSAAIRMPLAAGSGSEDQETALLVVRTQAAALILVAMGSSGPGIAQGAIAVAALAFVLGGLAARAGPRDAVQELSLLTIAASASVLGWVPAGWAWGALAAGTLIHHLRVNSDEGAPNVLVAGVLRGAGLGLPFLPAIAALLEGSIHEGNWYAVALSIAFPLGLALRARPSPEPETAGRRLRGSSAADLLTLGWLALASAAGLIGVVLALPRPPAGDPVSWPPVWAAAVVAVCGAVGARFPSFSLRRDDQAATRDGAFVRVPGVVKTVDRMARTRALEASLALLVGIGAVLWAAGFVRGFL